MAIEKITISTYVEQYPQLPVFDVRSPGEYSHAHIPGAFSLPIFNDEERKIIGTSYKQESREKAIKLGLDFFGARMRTLVEQTETDTRNFYEERGAVPQNERPSIIVHCWRGGMRSAAVAWLLDLYGFNVRLLIGGYKAYRNYVLAQFEKSYDFKLLGGFTGSGKTEILHCMKQHNIPVIDLEGLANHKGSAFGAIGQAPQPKQEMFENLLAEALEKMNGQNFWVEDESQRIGVLTIPHGFWKTMRQKKVVFVEIPFEERLNHILIGYGNLPKEPMLSAIQRIEKRLGPLETKTAIGFLVEDQVRECFRILLQYYDKSYKKALVNRENPDEQLDKLFCNRVDAVENAEKIMTCHIENILS